MAVYSIKELEKLSGIKAHTIRIWEKRYSLIEPHRTNTNIRYYTDSELKKILNVAVLNRHGIKISSIAKLNDLELREEIIKVSTTSDSSDTLIDSMVLSMIDLDEYKLEAMIDKSINKIGFKSTVTDVLYPFLEKVGILWQSGDVYPVQEHFVSFLIRQKIIAATDRISNTFNPNGKKFLLLLPEGEWHEIALLFAQYLIKEANHEVIYLGQSVPYSDVLAIGASKKFDFILVSSSTSQTGFDLGLYLEELCVAFPDKKILYLSSIKKELPVESSQNHIHLHRVSHLTNFIHTIS
ncbi:MAG: MerR family transcriptional regulator [Bacteroidales bacterium]|nr:MerR family transcriptional regulator [Bacteroidales bacterium]